MGCVWEERGLCLCGLAPRGVTITAQLPVASSLGAAALGLFSSRGLNPGVFCSSKIHALKPSNFFPTSKALAFSHLESVGAFVKVVWL